MAECDECNTSQQSHELYTQLALILIFYPLIKQKQVKYER